MENKLQKIRIRLFIVSFGVLIFSFFLIFKILYIQIHEGSYYKKLAKERTLKNFEIQASFATCFTLSKLISFLEIPKAIFSAIVAFIRNIF